MPRSIPRAAVARSRAAAPHHAEPHLVQFLELLAGRAGTGALLEIRWRRPGGMGQAWVRVETLERGARLIASRSAVTDVYVGCAPRTHRAGGREAIQAAWVLWADLDEPDLADRLPSVPVPPSAVVRSGSGGAHLYWSLQEPLAVADEQLSRVVDEVGVKELRRRPSRPVSGARRGPGSRP